MSCLALAAARPEAGYNYNRPGGGGGSGGGSGGGLGGGFGGGSHTQSVISSIMARIRICRAKVGREIGLP